MEQLEALALFKSVLLAPLGKAKPVHDQRVAEPPVYASSSVSRHDHHNIEIKTVSELTSAPSIVETDLYLFVPRSFEIGSVGKSDLVKDFRTRVRLALPMNGDQGAAAFESTLETFRQCLVRLNAMAEIGEVNASIQAAAEEEALEAVKDLCGVLAETLKHASAEHTRQFFLSHTLMTTSDACRKGVETLIGQVTSIHTMIDRVREMEVANHVAAHSVVRLFNEYVSQLYVQYLNSIRLELSRIEIPKKDFDAKSYGVIRKKLENVLDGLQEKEAMFRKWLGTNANGKESEIDREKRLVRMSQLKKFFQSKTFIDVAREQSAKKISESTATLGTALAGIFAATLERFSNPNVGGIAVHGFAFLCIGVVIYVLRDRMKDWAKARFHEKALQFLPDFEQQLMAKNRKIGIVKEWFRIMKSSEVPEDVRKIRQNAAADLMELRLPEDIFHCRKVQELQGTVGANETSPFVRALHENTRVNFERYLKYMDDPFKEVADLDSKGRFLRSRSHRVYHFYLCIRTKTRLQEQQLPIIGKLSSADQKNIKYEQQSILCRIVLDKNGVVRLEPLSS